MWILRNLKISFVQSNAQKSQSNNIKFVEKWDSRIQGPTHKERCLKKPFLVLSNWPATTAFAHPSGSAGLKVVLKPSPGDLELILSSLGAVALRVPAASSKDSHPQAILKFHGPSI